MPCVLPSFLPPLLPCELGQKTQGLPETLAVVCGHRERERERERERLCVHQSVSPERLCIDPAATRSESDIMLRPQYGACPPPRPPCTQVAGDVGAPPPSLSTPSSSSSSSFSFSSSSSSSRHWQQRAARQMASPPGGCTTASTSGSRAARMWCES